MKRIEQINKLAGVMNVLRAGKTLASRTMSEGLEATKPEWHALGKRVATGLGNRANRVRKAAKPYIEEFNKSYGK